MELGLASFGIALAAGGLSTLSPCVLPVLPIVLGSAVSAHRRGPVALAAGLALSFTVLGVALAAFGAALGLDPGVFRNVAAVLLLAFGVVLLSSRLQARLAVAGSGISSAGQGMLARLSFDGWPGQFMLGLLLGIVWTPCVGPTLGTAVTLASQGEQLAQVTLVMALFGLGAATPLVVLGALSREAVMRVRGRLLKAGERGKKVLGALMLGLGVFVLTGLDKQAEIWALDALPAWLTEVGTRL